MKALTIAAVAAALGISGINSPALAQGAELMNFVDRREVIINNTPDVQLSGFHFRNEFAQSSTRLSMNLKWQNTGQKDITAFDVVVVYFDPFNRPIVGPGGRWLITGHDSANWAPLKAGESGSDGTRNTLTQPIFTGVVYVKDIRFGDGSIWTAPAADVEQRIRASLPELRDLASVDPDKKDKPKP